MTPNPMPSPWKTRKRNPRGANAATSAGHLLHLSQLHVPHGPYTRGINNPTGEPKPLDTSRLTHINVNEWHRLNRRSTRKRTKK